MKVVMLMFAALVSAAAVGEEIPLDCSKLSSNFIATAKRNFDSRALCDLEATCRGQAEMLRILVSEQGLSGLTAVSPKSRAAIADGNAAIFRLTVLSRALDGDGKICWE